MIHNSFYFPSSDGKTTIHGEEWLPEGAPKAVLQIAHGIAEYVHRYNDFAAFLAENGIAVVGEDHIGHGESVAKGAPHVYFAEKDGWNKVVADIHTLRNMYGEKYPDVPYFLMGHSMGSFLARTYLIKFPGDVDGAVIMGTGQQSPALIAGGKAIGKIIGKLNGFDKPHDIVTNLAFGSYTKGIENVRTPLDWLSVNEENVDRYIADPKCGEPATVGLFLDMLGGIDFIRRQENVDKMDVTKPVLFIAGEKDPVGDFGKGVKAAFATFDKAGVKDLSCKLYPGLRHEILNEDCGKNVYEYIYDWLLERI
ncbi:MAG: lysophospholipase [Oscillospiraceae bacterium]|nr:lysophospholipase [Oscillospiraceae bacterium]MBR6658140.1 lysophospholipase [Oscillospiraceae bacterium]